MGVSVCAIDPSDGESDACVRRIVKALVDRINGGILAKHGGGNCGGISDGLVTNDFSERMVTGLREISDRGAKRFGRAAADQFVIVGGVGDVEGGGGLVIGDVVDVVGVGRSVLYAAVVLAAVVAVT